MSLGLCRPCEVTSLTRKHIKKYLAHIDQSKQQLLFIHHSPLVLSSSHVSSPSLPALCFTRFLSLFSLFYYSPSLTRSTLCSFRPQCVRMALGIIPWTNVCLMKSVRATHSIQAFTSIESSFCSSPFSPAAAISSVIQHIARATVRLSINRSPIAHHHSYKLCSLLLSHLI